jgi:hypothetical protein
MNKISEKDLIKLGFKKEKNSPLHELDEREFHYFVYEINKHCLLISSDNFDAEADGGYYVEFYEIPELKFKELEDLKALVKLLKKASK